jgi:hypothetical protein
VRGPAPSISIASPGDGGIVTAGATIPIAVAAENRVPVTGVVLQVNGVPFAMDGVAPFRFLVTVPAGVPAITLRASGANVVGDTGSSGDVTLSIVPDALTTVRGRTVDKAGKAMARADVKVKMNGLTADIYQFATRLTQLPKLQGKTPTRSTIVSAVNFRNPAMLFGADPFGFGPGSHVIRLSGELWAEEDGKHTFTLGVSEGGRLIIDGVTVIDIKAGAAGFREASRAVWLRKGPIPIEVITFDNGNPEVQLSYVRPGMAPQVVPPDELTPARPYMLVTGGTGLFSVAGVPTATGQIGIWATTWSSKQRRLLTGLVEPIDPVAGGVTDFGEITLR